MHSPEDLARARANADLHLLVRIEALEVCDPQPGRSRLRARIVAILGGHSAAAVGHGMHLEIWLDTRHRGQRSPPGDDLRMDLEDLLPGSQLQAYLRADSGAHCYQVVAGQIFALNSTFPHRHEPAADSRSDR
jgi:hypothetical protein